MQMLYHFVFVRYTARKVGEELYCYLKLLSDHGPNSAHPEQLSRAGELLDQSVGLHDYKCQGHQEQFLHASAGFDDCVSSALH